MNPEERNLVWLGYEDYTGLWQAAINVRTAFGLSTPEEGREEAREILAALLERGWIELYLCPEPLDNDTVRLVPPGDRAKLLDADESWAVPEQGDTTVRWGTTDEGYDAYTADFP